MILNNKFQIHKSLLRAPHPAPLLNTAPILIYLNSRRRLRDLIYKLCVYDDELNTKQSKEDLEKMMKNMNK